jgi:hypothetical protein
MAFDGLIFSIFNPKESGDQTNNQQTSTRKEEVFVEMSVITLSVILEDKK